MPFLGSMEDMEGKETHRKVGELPAKDPGQ